MSLHVSAGRLDPPTLDRDFVLHLGCIPGDDLPSRHRRMARPPCRHHDAHGDWVLRAHMGGARAPGHGPVQPMKLLTTGVSHKTAPVEVRECLAFREETLPAALADLRARPGVTEAVILSTCNRVEITLTTEDSADPQLLVDTFLSDHKSI